MLNYNSPKILNLQEIVDLIIKPHNSNKFYNNKVKFEAIY